MLQKNYTNSFTLITLEKTPTERSQHLKSEWERENHLMISVNNPERNFKKKANIKMSSN